jgi:hypothetical protein
VGWPVYSERVLVAKTGQVWITWTVPVGKRLIVKSINVSSFGTDGGRVDVNITSVYVGMFVLPAKIGSISFETMAVAYGGEVLGVFQTTHQLHTMISGWLLDDPGNHLGPPASAQQLPEWKPDLPLA